MIVSEGADSEGYVYTRRKYGFIDTAGKEVIPLEYDAALPFSEGVACVGKGPDLSWKYGYIDKNNQFVLPMQYNYASSFADGWAMVGTGGYGWQLRQSRFLSDDVSYTRRPQFGGSYRMINRSGGRSICPVTPFTRMPGTNPRRPGDWWPSIKTAKSAILRRRGFPPGNKAPANAPVKGKRVNPAAPAALFSKERADFACRLALFASGRKDSGAWGSRFIIKAG